MGIRRQRSNPVVSQHGARCGPFVCYCVVDRADSHREVFGRRLSSWMVEARGNMAKPTPPPARPHL